MPWLTMRWLPCIDVGLLAHLPKQSWQPGTLRCSGAFRALQREVSNPFGPPFHDLAPTSRPFEGATQAYRLAVRLELSTAYEQRSLLERLRAIPLEALACVTAHLSGECAQHEHPERG